MESRGDRAFTAQKKYRTMNPPIFSGEGDTMSADDWIRKVERIYKSLHMEEDDLRMATAPFYLEGKAARW